MDEKILEVEKLYDINLNEIAKDMLKNKSEDCNQCHSNCNDCGWDR